MLSGRFTAILIGIVALACFILTSLNVHLVNAQSKDNNSKVVYAGGGNDTSVSMSFVPKDIEIKAGESIVWTNPTPVSEQHSVTFVKDNKSFPDPVSTFVVPNSTKFQPLDPNSNSDPLFVPIPGENPQSKTVITANARAFIPVVIDSTGNVMYLPPNSNYTMDGTENYVNSGWLWPAGLAPPGIPPITKFTIKFEKPGTYPYVCNVHPWMTGTVTVK
jgi:plastocyanin